MHSLHFQPTCARHQRPEATFRSAAQPLKIHKKCQFPNHDVTKLVHACQPDKSHTDRMLLNSCWRSIWGKCPPPICISSYLSEKPRSAPAKTCAEQFSQTIVTEINAHRLTPAPMHPSNRPATCRAGTLHRENMTRSDWKERSPE